MTTRRQSSEVRAAALPEVPTGALQALYTDAATAETATMDPDRSREAEDVAAALAGDENAFARIVARRQGEVARVLWRFTRDPGRLDELVQDTFVAVFKSLRSFDPRRPLGPWLRKIAVRTGYRHWKDRARARDHVPLEAAAEPAAPERLTPESAAEKVHALLARLSPRDRLVLTLIYLEGRTVAEAADLAGWSTTMTKVQAYRARARLRRLLARGVTEGAGK